MLNFLRKQAQSPVIQGVVVVIAVVFVFWGVGTNLHGQRTTVAEVNGAAISYQEYQRAYEQAIDGLQQQFGGQMPQGLVEQLGIGKQVVYRLIQAELLRQGGDEMGVAVSNLPVSQKIEKMEAFHDKGRFDLQRYKDVLSQNRMTPNSFEEGVKSDLRTSRVQELVGSFAVVSDTAVSHWRAYAEEEVKLAYVKLEPAAFEDKVQMDEKGLAAWFEKNKALYKSEPKVRLNYLFFDQNEDEKQVKVSEEELRSLYEREKNSYQLPEQRHVRQILFKVEKGADEAARAEKKRKAEEALVLARQPGSDFAALAKERSEDDASKELGGDLGFMAAGRMAAAMDKAIFAMKAGEVAGPLETEQGYHVVRLEEVRPASVPSFDQLRDSLAKEAGRQQAKGLAFKRAAAAYEAVMRAGSLEKYSQQAQGSVLATDYFSRSTPPKDMPSDPKLIDAAFALKKGELSSILELEKGYAVLFADDLQEPQTPGLDAVREKAVADWKKEKAGELAAKAAQDLLDAGKKLKSLQEAAAVQTLELKTAESLRRSAMAADKDQLPQQVVEDAFKLAWKDRLPAKPLFVDSAWFAYEIAERKAGADAAADAGERDQERQRMLESARYELLSAWIHGIQTKSSIWINEAILK